MERRLTPLLRINLQDSNDHTISPLLLARNEVLGGYRLRVSWLFILPAHREFHRRCSDEGRKLMHFLPSRRHELSILWWREQLLELSATFSQGVDGHRKRRWPRGVSPSRSSTMTLGTFLLREICSEEGSANRSTCRQESVFRKAVRALTERESHILPPREAKTTISPYSIEPIRPKPRTRTKPRPGNEVKDRRTKPRSNLCFITLSKVRAVAISWVSR